MNAELATTIIRVDQTRAAIAYKKALDELTLFLETHKVRLDEIEAEHNAAEEARHAEVKQKCDEELRPLREKVERLKAEQGPFLESVELRNAKFSLSHAEARAMCRFDYRNSTPWYLRKDHYELGKRYAVAEMAIEPLSLTESAVVDLYAMERGGYISELWAMKQLLAEITESKP